MTCPYRHRTKHQDSSGFVLVLALVLMAFVLLLLLTMSTLVEVEAKAATHHLNTLRAQQGARLALMMAVGELQKHAGPDQRVTARAEIAGGSEPFWTGVWDTTDPTASPRWLVSWQDQSQPANTESMRLVGPGTAGTESAHYVSAPIIEVTGTDNAVSDKIAWWIGDEGVKASVGRRPLHIRADPNFTADRSLAALHTMLSSSQGLAEIFEDYDRYTSDDAASLSRISTLQQLVGQADFRDDTTWDLSGENVFHSVTPISLGVLASVLPDANGGLMQDLSLFPKLIGAEFENTIERAAASAEAKSSATTPVQALQRSTDLRGLDDLGTLADGDLASPVTPILSNFMMAFTIYDPVGADPSLYLRMRFFCEFWNPFTETLKMTSASGSNLNLELEIYGLPTVQVIKSDGTTSNSATVNMQSIVAADPSDPNSPLVITLINNPNDTWLPGHSKNWTGVDADETAGRSPYDSTVTTSKQWKSNKLTLGGSTGLNTNIDLIGTDDLSIEGSGSTSLDIHVYVSNGIAGERKLLSKLENIRYEPVATLPRTYTNKSMNFGYHFILRGPYQSNDDTEYFRGRWLNDHDHRNPSPIFYNDWNLTYDSLLKEGSSYIPVQDGITPLLNLYPHDVSEANSTINTVIFRRLWDRSGGASGSASSFNKLWQDAPLFELLRERPLSLASLQHLYFHNERPFKVGNSWGGAGAANTLAWFDRYYFSGLNRSDAAVDYVPNSGLPNPTLLAYNFETPGTKITRWQTTSSDDAKLSAELAQNVLVMNRFNLNSTSVVAWKAVLGGLRIKQLKFLDYPEGDTSDLSTLSVGTDLIQTDARKCLFSRFSQSLFETYEAPQTPAFKDTEPVAPSAYYRRGARYFDSAEIEALATEIVRLIKHRGEPFHSMQAFLSADAPNGRSLLEQAIATVLAPSGRQRWDHPWEIQGTRGPAAEIIDIDHFSPGFLTQADVMTAIGPILAPRSDTFKIRARGDSYSTQGEATASATLEATFQRTPEAVNSAIPINRPTKRKLQLLSIRWISNNER
jgi:hypothetical protein